VNGDIPVAFGTKILLPAAKSSLKEITTISSDSRASYVGYFSSSPINNCWLPETLHPPGKKSLGKDSHVKRTGGCSSYLSGVKKAVLVSLRVFSLKNVHRRSFRGIFKGIEQKKIWGELILYFPIAHNSLCLPPKFCINYCHEMLLGICRPPKCISQQ